MDNERASVKKFSRYVLLGQLVSVGSLILGVVFITEEQDVVLQGAGWLFLLMGIVFVFTFNQRKQRLLWIYKKTSPKVNMSIFRV